jgi:DNA-binding cell septation regulator SpoVG
MIPTEAMAQPIRMREICMAAIDSANVRRNLALVNGRHGLLLNQRSRRHTGNQRWVEEIAKNRRWGDPAAR